MRPLTAHHPYLLRAAIGLAAWLGALLIAVGPVWIDRARLGLPVDPAALIAGYVVGFAQ
ncbi:hypothetical protein [Hyphobacterium sp.]|uniref:hypothetical protein n=1 Tax=Hyphobacterium sp. TaxID=2004662 RepID=UPI003B52F472